MLLYFLDYTVPAYSSSLFCYFLPYNPISYGWQPLIWHVPYSILPGKLSRLYLFQEGTFPVLLLILYYSSYLSILVFFSCRHLYCVQLLNLSPCSFPMLLPHILALVRSLQSDSYLNPSVSRCESVGIASTLPTCDLPFPTVSRLIWVHPKSTIFRSLR